MHDDTLDGQLPQIDIGEPMQAYIGKLDAEGVPVLDKGGLTVRSTGAPVNFRVDVTVEVRTKAGTLIGTAIAMDYVTTSDGHYMAEIPSTLTAQLKDGVEYQVRYLCATILCRRLWYRAGYRGHQ